MYSVPRTDQSAVSSQQSAGLRSSWPGRCLLSLAMYSYGPFGSTVAKNCPMCATVIRSTLPYYLLLLDKRLGAKGGTLVRGTAGVSLCPRCVCIASRANSIPSTDYMHQQGRQINAVDVFKTFRDVDAWSRLSRCEAPLVRRGITGQADLPD